MTIEYDEKEFKSWFATNLRYLREQRGWTPTALAFHSGVSVRTIEKYESADRLPGFLVLRQLAAGLNVSLDMLMCGEEHKQETSE